MRQHTVGCLIVADREQFPLGILTDRDLVMRVVAAQRDAARTTVGEVMTRFPELAHEDMPIEAALELMRRRAFRRLPVIDKDGRVSGVVTLDDILILLTEELTQIGEILRRETPQAVAAAIG